MTFTVYCDAGQLYITVYGDAAAGGAAGADSGAGARPGAGFVWETGDDQLDRLLMLHSADDIASTSAEKGGAQKHLEAFCEAF